MFGERRHGSEAGDGRLRVGVLHLGAGRGNGGRTQTLAARSTDDKTTGREGRRGNGSWRTMLVLLVVVLAVTGAGVGWLISRTTRSTDPIGATDSEFAARVAVVNWTIGLGVLLALVLLASLVRQWLAATERQVAATEAELRAVRDQLTVDRGVAQRQAAATEQNLLAERFSRAIAQATGDSPALKAIGLLALEELAIEDEEQFAEPVYEFLVALVKEKATPEPEQRERFEKVAEPAGVTSLHIRPLDADGATAITVLTRNRRLFDRNIAALSADSVANGGNGLHLVDTDLSGAWLRGLSLAGATLTNVRLNRSVLIDVDLSEAFLTDCRASHAAFGDVDFTKARFHSATFAESTFDDTRFDRATLSATDFGASTITKTSFNRANATGTRFVGAVFTDTTFDDSLLTGTSFHDARFTDGGEATTSFTRSTLSSVAFTKATFTATGFNRTAINDADFAGARLTRADFTGANLRQTNFRDADLNEVAFDGADLFDVRFDEPTSKGSDLFVDATVTDEAPVPDEGPESRRR